MKELPAPKWLEFEIEEQFFDNLRAKLKAGGATLTQDECDVLLDLIKEQPKRKRDVGRPTDEPSSPGATWWLGLACIVREIKGAPTKVAVGDIAHKNNISRSKVYAARQRLLSKEFK